MLSQTNLDFLALIVAVIGTITSIFYSAYNKRIIQKQFDLQFASNLVLIIPKRTLLLRDANLQLLIRNNGPQAANQVKLFLVHQPTGNILPIDPSLERTISANETLPINSFIEINSIFQALKVYDPISHKILSREPVHLAIRCEWTISGVNKIKNVEKEVTFIWSGGKHGSGVEWEIY